jgi:DNA (cytosine-5)-methyltransferase 1
MGVEIMPEAVATREANGMHTIYRDVWDGLTGPALSYDLLIASPPCQTFSVAGKGAGRAALDDVIEAIQADAYKDPLSLREFGERHDPRTALVLTPLAHVWRDRPRLVTMEQVPTVLPVWEACAQVMRGLGYSVKVANLQAEQFGVPQTRKRAILVARLDGDVRLPLPTHSKYYSTNPAKLDPGVKKWVSMAETLGRGLTDRPSPTITGGGTETGGAEPIAKLARYTELSSWKWFDAPATTIAGDPRITAREHHFHGEQSKTSLRLTPTEAASLQSYPEGFQFAGGQGKQFLQIGNAVPPLLAEAILTALTAPELDVEDLLANELVTA